MQTKRNQIVQYTDDLNTEYSVAGDISILSTHSNQFLDLLNTTLNFRISSLSGVGTDHPLLANGAITSIVRGHQILVNDKPLFQTSNMSENQYFALQHAVWLLSPEDQHIADSQGSGSSSSAKYNFDYFYNPTSKEYQAYLQQKESDLSSFHRWYALASQPAVDTIANYILTHDKHIYNVNVSSKISQSTDNANPLAGWYSVKLKYLFPQLFFTLQDFAKVDLSRFKLQFNFKMTSNLRRSTHVFITKDNTSARQATHDITLDQVHVQPVLLEHSSLEGQGLLQTLQNGEFSFPYIDFTSQSRVITGTVDDGATITSQVNFNNISIKGNKQVMGLLFVAQSNVNPPTGTVYQDGVTTISTSALLNMPFFQANESFLPVPVKRIIAQIGTADDLQTFKVSVETLDQMRLQLQQDLVEYFGYDKRHILSYDMQDMLSRLYYVPLMSSSMSIQASQINTIIDATVEFQSSNANAPDYIPGKSNMIMYVMYRDGIHLKPDGDVEGVKTVNIRQL